MAGNDENKIIFGKAETYDSFDTTKRDLPFSRSDESSPSATTKPHSSTYNEALGGKIYNPNINPNNNIFPYNGFKP